MNFTTLAENLDVEKKEFLAIMELFIKTSTSSLNQLQSALHEGEAEKVMKCAHFIKGAASNLRIMNIFEAAKRMEKGASKKNLDGATEAIRVIKEELDRIAESLKAEGSPLNG